MQRTKTVPLYGDPARGSKLIGYYAPETGVVYTTKLNVSQADTENASKGKGDAWANLRRGGFTRFAGLAPLGIHANRKHQARLDAVKRQGL